MSDGLNPRNGFDWARVVWSAADAMEPQLCSYCRKKLDRDQEDDTPGEDDVPLMLWDKDGNLAVFCLSCQAHYWDIAAAAALAPVEERPDLGLCCGCEMAAATGLAMLPRRARFAGHGWGCAVCGLPPDGAVVVLCAACGDKFEAGELTVERCCAGYPATEGRVSIDELPPGAFEHDMTKHRETEKMPIADQEFADREEELMSECCRIFAGRDPALVSAVLADLCSIWLASHVVVGDPGKTAALRKQLLNVHVSLIKQLLPLNANRLGNG